MLGSLTLKLKYLFYICLSIFTAFFTYSSLVNLSQTTMMETPTLMLNTVILMALWSFSFTSRHSFIQDNFLTIVALPFIALTGGNLILAFVSSGSGIVDYSTFLISSGMLLLLSHRASILESRIREED